MKTALVEVRGIGPATAQLLAVAGIESAEDLADRPVKEVVLVQGFSDIRAAQVVAAARALVTEAQRSAAEAGASTTPKQPGKSQKAAKAAKGKKEKSKKKEAKKDKKDDKGKKKTDKKTKSAPKATKKTKKKK